MYFLQSSDPTAVQNSFPQHTVKVIQNVSNFVSDGPRFRGPKDKSLGKKPKFQAVKFID
jgi:hypothetical protein